MKNLKEKSSPGRVGVMPKPCSVKVKPGIPAGDMREVLGLP